MKLRLCDRGPGFHYRYLVVADDLTYSIEDTSLWRRVRDYCLERFGPPGGAEGLHAVMDIHMIMFKVEADALIFCMEFKGE